MARRRYMHGKRRRKSSCAPFKHNHTLKDAQANAIMAQAKKDQEKNPDDYFVSDTHRKPPSEDGGGILGKIISDPHTSTIQKIQTGLTGVELLGGHPYLELASTVAGGINTLISGGRAGYHYLRGEDEAAKSNLIDAGMSGWGMFPYGGYAGTLAKVAKMEKGYEAAKAVDKTIDVVGKSRHLQHGGTMVTGGAVQTGSLFNPELTGSGWGEGSNYQKSLEKKSKNPDLKKDIQSPTSNPLGWLVESGTHGGVFIGKAYNPKTGESERKFTMEQGATTSDVLTALTKWGKHPQKKK